MNNKSFPVQIFSDDINGKTDSDNLVLILKPSGGVMLAEAIPDENEGDRKTRHEPRLTGLKTDYNLGNLKIL